MDFIALPIAMLESPEYRKLAAQYRVLLVDLYVKFGDCSRFMIDPEEAKNYGYSEYSTLCYAITKLLSVGLIENDGKLHKNKRGAPRRIFRFRYPAFDISEAG